MKPLRRIAVLSVAAVSLFATAAPAQAVGSAEPLLTGLSSPKGLDNTGIDLIVGQGAFGAPGPVLHYQRSVAGRPVVPITEPMGAIDVAVSPLDGTVWILGGDQVLYHRLANGTVAPVANIAAYQQTDPDPTDLEEDPTETNPYGLTVHPNGDALVVDAANNDLLRITPLGAITTVARFDVERVQTDHFEAPLPDRIPAESVPTTVTVGPDGRIYVGELKGFPFRPGSSRIWRINPNAVGALCSVNTPDARCKTFDKGFTAIQDIAFDPSGVFYVYELAEGGVFAFDAGFESGEFPPAVLLRVKDGVRTTLADGQLREPGSVVVLDNGQVFVTDRVFTENGGRVLRVRLGTTTT